ncbi:hypothetical protein R1sor_007864 [Riccia sorocarpa]|uniref:Uncharacterized protein n=1 Tax=Riccia sorocarpa TaxID=122646 RepID=A0ABD3HRY8_9MARC
MYNAGVVVKEDKEHRVASHSRHLTIACSARQHFLCHRGGSSWESSAGREGVHRAEERSSELGDASRLGRSSPASPEEERAMNQTNQQWTSGGTHGMISMTFQLLLAPIFTPFASDVTNDQMGLILPNGNDGFGDDGIDGMIIMVVNLMAAIGTKPHRNGYFREDGDCSKWRLSRWTPVEAIRWRRFRWRGTPAEAIPVEAIPAEGAPVEAIPVEGVPIEATPMSAIPAEGVLLGMTHE